MVMDYVSNLQLLQNGEELNSSILNKYKTEFADLLKIDLPYTEFFKQVSQGQMDMVIK